ncbi:hypothetical protein JCM14469_43090 [Desulfatiferula olefinivorans]
MPFSAMVQKDYRRLKSTWENKRYVYILVDGMYVFQSTKR